MSEIKGQLLGIILTICIFSVVLGAMVTTFGHVGDAISERADEVVTTEPVYTPGS